MELESTVEEQEQEEQQEEWYYDYPTVLAGEMFDDKLDMYRNEY